MSDVAGDDRVVDLEVELLIEAIYRRYGYDFRHYARASLRRRVLGARHPAVAMSLHQLGLEAVRRGRARDAERMLREGLAPRGGLALQIGFGAGLSYAAQVVTLP